MIEEHEPLFFMATVASVNVQLCRVTSVDGTAETRVLALRRREVRVRPTMVLMVCEK